MNKVDKSPNLKQNPKGLKQEVLDKVLDILQTEEKTEKKSDSVVNYLRKFLENRTPEKEKALNDAITKTITYFKNQGINISEDIILKWVKLKKEKSEKKLTEDEIRDINSKNLNKLFLVDATETEGFDGTKTEVFLNEVEKSNNKVLAEYPENLEAISIKKILNDLKADENFSNQKGKFRLTDIDSRTSEKIRKLYEDNLKKKGIKKYSIKEKAETSGVIQSIKDMLNSAGIDDSKIDIISGKSPKKIVIIFGEFHAGRQDALGEKENNILQQKIVKSMGKIFSKYGGRAFSEGVAPDTNTKKELKSFEKKSAIRQFSNKNENAEINGFDSSGSVAAALVPFSDYKNLMISTLRSLQQRISLHNLVLGNNIVKSIKKEDERISMVVVGSDHEFSDSKKSIPLSSVISQSGEILVIRVNMTPKTRNSKENEQKAEDWLRENAKKLGDILDDSGLTKEREYK